MRLNVEVLIICLFGTELLTLHVFLTVMTNSSIKEKLKPWMLPIAILCGLVFHRPIGAVQWVLPYLIFVMLLVTFCRVRPSDIRFDGMIWRLLAVQVVGSIAVFFLIRPLHLPTAQGLMVCVLCPTATAAPVVTGMLGGSVGRTASYSIVSNLTTALFAPLMFVVAGAEGNVSFFQEFMLIVMKVAPMIAFPLGLAFLMYFTAPKLHAAVERAQGGTFYLWAVSLTLVVGKAVSFVLAEPASAIPAMVSMALGAAVLCVAQFAVGRRIGSHYNEKITAAQSLGQKNTVLAIWMSINYLNPISSVAPAAYIAWQNTLNSLQLYFKMRRGRAL